MNKKMLILGIVQLFLLIIGGTFLGFNYKLSNDKNNLENEKIIFINKIEENNNLIQEKEKEIEEEVEKIEDSKKDLNKKKEDLEKNIKALNNDKSNWEKKIASLEK